MSSVSCSNCAALEKQLAHQIEVTNRWKADNAKQREILKEAAYQLKHSGMISRHVGSRRERVDRLAERAVRRLAQFRNKLRRVLETQDLSPSLRAELQAVFDGAWENIPIPIEELEDLD